MPFVDLIRVLEYQSRSKGVPKSLADHFADWPEPDARRQGFEEVARAPDSYD